MKAKDVKRIVSEGGWFRVTLKWLRIVTGSILSIEPVDPPEKARKVKP